MGVGIRVGENLCLKMCIVEGIRNLGHMSKLRALPTYRYISGLAYIELLGLSGNKALF